MLQAAAVKHGPVEPLQVIRGIDAKLGDHDFSEPLEDIERPVNLAGTGQGAHQLPGQAFIHRVLENEPAEFRHQAAVLPQPQIGLDPLLKRPPPSLFEPDKLRFQHPPDRDAAQRGAVPQVKRLIQEPGGGKDIAVIHGGCPRSESRRKSAASSRQLPASMYPS